MKQETHDKIKDALQALDEATRVPGIMVLALAMSHGEHGRMRVQMMGKGEETMIAHKIYECMRNADILPVDLRNIIMTAAAKWLAEQPIEAQQAFDRTVDKCRKCWDDVQQLQAVIDDARQVIDEIGN